MNKQLQISNVTMNLIDILVKITYMTKKNIVLRALEEYVINHNISEGIKYLETYKNEDKKYNRNFK